MNSHEWKPSCSIQILRIRAAMLQAIREFFQARGYLEVETPCLSRDIVIDACLDPIEVSISAERWFLQTSPEAFMKRLLAAGAGSIFQISRVFRQGEFGEKHNPEFTMIEWYGVATTWEEQLDLTESLVRSAMTAASPILGKNAAEFWPDQRFRRTSYADAFSRVLGINVHSIGAAELLTIAAEKSIPLPEPVSGLTTDDILNALLAFCIEPGLGRTADGKPSPEFLCDFPPGQAALAVVSETEPHVARRFELYIDALELCNGYQELTNVSELRRRDVRQNSLRSGGQQKTLPGASRLLDAMESGLPECSGVALGFDRLMMAVTEKNRLAEVMSFSFERS